jgi:hypothetical protein
MLSESYHLYTFLVKQTINMSLSSKHLIMRLAHDVRDFSWSEIANAASLPYE